MSIEVGSKVSGKISGITNFGAFVDLGDKNRTRTHQRSFRRFRQGYS